MRFADALRLFARHPPGYEMLKNIVVRPRYTALPLQRRLGIDEAQAGETAQQAGEHDLGLHQCQAGADAHVRPRTEGQQAAGAARQVQAIGFA